MPTFTELEQAAISSYDRGDIEGAKRLKKQALATREFEALEAQAISAFDSGDVDTAKKLKRQALDVITPFEESVFTDIGRGIKAAPVSMAQGISEAAAAGLDLSMGTEYSRPVTEAFENFKREYDLDPRTAAGDTAEELVSFGLGFIPVAGWLGRANTVAKGSRVLSAPAKSRFFRSAENFGGSDIGKALLGSRTGLIGSTALATLGYEALITPDGRPTLSDSFDFMPDALRTTDTSNMSGSELAYNKISNKFKSGVEAGLASLTLDVGLPVAGAVIRGIGTVPGVSDVASTLASKSQQIFSYGTDLISKLPGAKTTGTKLKDWFSPAGLSDSKVMEEVFDVKAVRDTAEREAFQYWQGFEKGIGEFMSIINVPKMTKKSRGAAKEKLYKFLTTGDETFLSGFKEPAKKSAQRMLRLDQEFQDKMIFELEDLVGDATGGPLKDALETIKQNRNTTGAYLRRRFEMYDDPEKYFDKLDFNSPQYNTALGEMKQFVRQRNMKSAARKEEYESLFGSGTYTPNLSEAELDELAERKLMKYIGIELSEGRLKPQDALREKQNALKEIGKTAQPGRAVSLVDNMFIERVPELNSLPKTRELMGEVTDPKEAYLRTISDMAQTTSGLRFYRQAAQDVSQGGFSVAASDAVNLLKSGQRPAIIRNPLSEEGFAGKMGIAIDPDRPGLAEASAENLFSSAGYVKLGDEGAALFGPFVGLTETWVRPEVKNALTTPARLGMDELGQAVAMGAVLKGQAQRMTIVPNILSQVRNITGNGIALAQNANLSKNSDVFDTFRLIASNAEIMDDDAVRKYAQELGALGVMDTSLVTSALQEFKSMAKEFKWAGKLQKGFDNASNFIPFMQQLEKTYSGSDSFFKMAAVFAEQSKVTNALGKANLDINALPKEAFEALQKNFIDQGIAKRGGSLSLDQSPANFLLTMAGDTVKDTMPVYNRVGKAIKRLDAIPFFGNFTSFASENIRNSSNTLARGVSELAFKADDQLIKAIGPEAARALELQIRGIGAQRLTSYVAVSAMAPASITKASMLATGTSEEELNAAKTLAADYYAGHELFVIDNDKRGNITLGDQSYIFPHAFVLDPARAALQNYYSQGELGKDQASRILSSAWTGVKGYAEPFASESLIYERVRDVLPQAWIGRDGETQSGARVYGSSESFGDKLSKSVAHILGTYIPGYGRMIFEERAGEFQQGRLNRALSDLPGSRGQTYTVNEELARSLTGITPIVVNTRTDFGFKGGEYLPLRSDAKGSANRIIKRADSTVEDMREGWKTYLENLYNAQSRLYYNVQAARAMGASDSVIREQLVGSGVGGAEATRIMAGEFWPGQVSKEVIQETYRDLYNEDKKIRDRDIPWAEFNEMSAEMMFRPLSAEAAKQEREARLRSKQEDRRREADQAAAGILPADPPLTSFQPGLALQGAQDTYLVPEPQPSESFVDRAVTSAQRLSEGLVDRARTIAPSILGDNLSDQAANAEIARRQ